MRASTVEFFGLRARVSGYTFALVMLNGFNHEKKHHTQGQTAKTYEQILSLP